MPTRSHSKNRVNKNDKERRRGISDKNEKEIFEIPYEAVNKWHSKIQ